MTLKFSTGSKSTTIIIHILVWGIVLCVPLLIPDPYNNAFPISYDFIVGFIHLGLFYFNAFFLYPKLMTRKLWWVYTFTLIPLIMGTFQLKYFILKIGFPKVNYKEEMNFLLGFPILLFVVAGIIYGVVSDRIHQEKKLKEQEAQQLFTELKFLRSQISPHFLFNVLNNMVSMARHKSDQLEPSLIRLAGLMRYMLYDSDAKKVPLSQEIEYLKSYIELQKIRFSDNVDIDIDLQGGTKAFSIEPMLLIPFIENAFKHGVVLVKHPFIEIQLKVDGDVLYFSVENKYSEEPHQSKDKDSGIGLANIKTRLELLYPGMHTLSICDNNGIFKVELKLPIK